MCKQEHYGATLLLGKPVVEAMKAETVHMVETLKEQGVMPTLAFVRVGNNEDDLSYQRSAEKRASARGIATREFVLEGASAQELRRVIQQVNTDPSIHGALVFRPLPTQEMEDVVASELVASKDVDGITKASLAGVFADSNQGFAPCTAQACVEMLDAANIDVCGKHVVVVGRSLVIGKPVACMLLRRNATVTIAHSKTVNLPQAVQQADIVVCATGRAKAFGAECFSAGQVVLDVGINFDAQGNLCGDVDTNACEHIVGAITPVPGGIGSVTTEILMRHVVEASQRSPTC